MTIDAAAIAAKVLARLAADTGAGGLFASGATLISEAVWNMATESQTTPYLVYDVAIQQGPGETFEGNSIEATVRMLVVTDRYATGLNGLERMSAINKRLYGDSGSAAGVPSYGFHRWLMSGLTGWTPTHMRFVGQDVQSDEDRIGATSEFTFTLQQTW